MPISSFSAAKMICDRGGWRLTNLELQKILYLAHMLHMGRNDGARLVDASFEAWDYGPVEPHLYRRVSMFGSDQIEDVFFNNDFPDENTAEHASLVEASEFLIGKSAGELVSLTHWTEGAWAQVYEPGVRHIQIPDELILNEYRARAERASATAAA
jgi:uncharacterized phage-associated protein